MDEWKINLMKGNMAKYEARCRRLLCLLKRILALMLYFSWFLPLSSLWSGSLSFKHVC